jgi:2-oxoglutarate/2-oxoacid ferredoxin oxidoreductase subunit alpha
MRWSIICGGPAGAGPNFVSNLLSKLLLASGFNVFSSREYESRIRGGHNYNIVTFSDSSVNSNITKVNLLIALDDLAETSHQNEIDANTLVVKGNTNNAYLLGQAAKILSLDFSLLDSLLKSQQGYEENFKEVKAGYDFETRSLQLPKLKKQKLELMTGSEAIAIGAINSDLDFYYGYPMTPATTVMFELAARESKFKHKIVELESEIACVNAAVGSSIVGKKSMVGTSGGGFDLMTETLSMTGIAKTPIVFYLCQRVGPGTGAATSQSQGDLKMALYSGHGEFARVVASPGDTADCAELTSQLFYLTQKYQIPVILLSDKHLAESLFTTNPKFRFAKSISTVSWPSRFTSYVANENAIASGNPAIIKKDAENRLKNQSDMAKEIEKFETYRVFGNKSSNTTIISWGSTKGAILDILPELNCKFIQILYLEPFSQKLVNEIKSSQNIIVVENNSTSPLSSLIAEKCLIQIPEKNKILKYDGRPFMSDGLLEQIKSGVNNG